MKTHKNMVKIGNSHGKFLRIYSKYATQCSYLKIGHELSIVTKWRCHLCQGLHGKMWFSASEYSYDFLLFIFPFILFLLKKATDLWVMYQWWMTCFNIETVHMYMWSRIKIKFKWKITHKIRLKFSRILSLTWKRCAVQRKHIFMSSVYRNEKSSLIRRDVCKWVKMDGPRTPLECFFLFFSFFVWMYRCKEAHLLRYIFIKALFKMSSFSLLVNIVAHIHSVERVLPKMNNTNNKTNKSTEKSEKFQKYT